LKNYKNIEGAVGAGATMVMKAPLGAAASAAPGGTATALEVAAPVAVAAPVPVSPGEVARWDGRFVLSLEGRGPTGLWLGGLGPDSPAVMRVAPATLAAAIPAAARPALPVLRDAKGVVAVPALGYFKCCSQEATTAACQLRFRPTRPLTGAGFTIV